MIAVSFVYHAARLRNLTLRLIVVRYYVDWNTSFLLAVTSGRETDLCDEVQIGMQGTLYLHELLRIVVCAWKEFRFLLMQIVMGVVPHLECEDI